MIISLETFEFSSKIFIIIKKQEIIKEISVNTSQDILDILINFSQNIMDNRTDDDDDSIPEILFNKALKEIQLIYQKEISEVI